MTKNVLADNPLDFMVGAGSPASNDAKSTTANVSQLPPAAPATAEPPVAPAATQQDKSSAQAPRAQAAARPSAVDARPPLRTRQSKTRKRRSGAPVASTAAGKGEADASSARNRIGTIKEPYTRSDGVTTRQASVTLPVDLLKRLNHWAIDTGMKTSEIHRAALEEYLEQRGH